MKIGRRRVQLLLFLLASILASEAADTSLIGEPLAKNAVPARSPGDLASPPAVGVNAKSAPIGTEHAPVDGKDGMPHEGPFVETTAERERKKTQGSSYDDDVVVEKPKSKASSKDDVLPQSNDAVMDDRKNSNPAEGTRGVEGGISEKSKEGKSADKKPDPPKDARPLPHSEAEKIKDSDASQVLPVDEEPKKVLTVSTTSFLRIHPPSDFAAGSSRPSRKALRYPSP